MSAPPFSRRDFIRCIAGGSAASLTGNARLHCAEAPTTASTLAPAMERAAACCLAWLNPQEQFLPTGGYEVAHDTGRWWDAMLRYESVMHVPIPGAAEEAMLKNIRRLADERTGLLTDKLCNPHNLRESLLAYAALVRFRKSDWARDAGNKLVAVVADLLRPDGQLDYEKLAAETGRPLTKDKLMVQQSPPGQWFNATATTGRMIEALMFFYDSTGDPPAWELARKLCEVHLKQAIDPTGVVRADLLDSGHVGHTHSYCGTLRGLLLYGLSTQDAAFTEAISLTYSTGLWRTVISHSGWTPHDQGKVRFPNKEGEPVGEHASCGDVAQIALWLALRAGQTQHFDDVERLTRCRLLPSQLSDPSNPRRDGAWGVYSHPFGYGAILDVFAAVLHSLADIQHHIVTFDERGASVNLHFNVDTPTLSVQVKREGAATMHVQAKSPGNIRLRVPGWTDRTTVRLSMNGLALPLNWEGNYVVIANDQTAPETSLALSYDLPEAHTEEVMPVSHRKFSLAWKGDSIVRCSPQVPIFSP